MDFPFPPFFFFFFFFFFPLGLWLCPLFLASRGAEIGICFFFFSSLLPQALGPPPSRFFSWGQRGLEGVLFSFFSPLRGSGLSRLFGLDLEIERRLFSFFLFFFSGPRNFSPDPSLFSHGGKGYSPLFIFYMGLP